jgi:HEAT repeat protein
MSPTRITGLLATTLLLGGIGAGVALTPGAVPAPPEQPPAKAPQPGPEAAREQLKDPDPRTRLKAALARAADPDEEVVTTLIDLLAVLPLPERKKAEVALQGIAMEWATNATLAGDDEISRNILRDAWAGWWRNTDGPVLLAAFRKRTLTPEQVTAALAHVAALDDEKYATRQRAMADLVALGPPVVPLLRRAVPGKSLEQASRLEQCIEQIAKVHGTDDLPTVAARLVALRKPTGATAALVAYLPFNDDELMQAEVAAALHRLARTGPPDVSVVKALEDSMPVRRAVAGEVLAAVNDAEVRAAVRKLLADPDPAVRLRVAVALACAADKEAVPVLIELVGELPADQAWQADEILRTIAGAKAPPGTADDAAACKKLQGAWRAWHTANAGNLKLAVQPLPEPYLGFTTIAAFSMPPDRTRSKIIEVDRRGKVRWQFTCYYPVDVQVLPHGRVLVSECEAGRVTERDFRGNILWQVIPPSAPYNVKRLPSGNTFVSTNSRLLEYDPAGKLVLDRHVGGMIAAQKLPDGQFVYLTGKGECVRLDADGNEVKRFKSGENGHSGCVLDLSPRGDLLVSQCGQSMAEEFNLDGKTLWKTPEPVAPGAPGIVTATRTGHIICAVFYQSTVLELDRSGKTVWRYETPGYQPFLARRR